KRQFRLSLFEFFSASRKETIKTTRHAHHNDGQVIVPPDFWRVGISFGKIDNVAHSPMEQFSAEIYLNFTGFNQKCFIGRAMQVRRRYIAGRRGKPQHAKGVIRLLELTRTWASCPKARIIRLLSTPTELDAISP